jgi:hypothetical protein
MHCGIDERTRSSHKFRYCTIRYLEEREKSMLDAPGSNHSRGGRKFVLEHEKPYLEIHAASWTVNTVVLSQGCNVKHSIILFPTLRMSGAVPTYVLYEGVSKIFRTGAAKIINLTTKRVWKLLTSTQLRATWHADSLNMIILPSAGASRCHIYCIDGGTSPEYYGYILLRLHDTESNFHFFKKYSLRKKIRIMTQL